MCDIVQAVAIYNGSHFLESFNNSKYPIRLNKIITGAWPKAFLSVSIWAARAETSSDSDSVRGKGSRGSVTHYNPW